jgi:hypothetical protein
LTQGKFTKVDDADYDRLSKHKWYAQKNCRDGLYYAARGKRENGRVIKIYMHREIMNCPPGKEVDHENHKTLDNQQENLRACTRKENLKNRF